MGIKGSSRSAIGLLVLIFTQPVFAKRGDLLKIDKIETVKQADLKHARSQFFPKMKIPDPRNGVVIYKINYETIDLSGAVTTASGAMLVPDSIDKSFPLLSYEHGTALNRENVPSRANIESAAVAVSFGGMGYVIAEPDYLGGGDNTVLHPYHHADSEAWASIDMLRATKTAAAQLGIGLNSQLFLTGYSQGGHATMALQRELEKNNSDEFQVTASGPMSGAYDLSHTTLQGVMTNPTKNSVAEVAFMLVSMNAVYGLYPSFDQVIDSKYSALLTSLFDGSHDWEDVEEKLPPTPKELGTAAFVDDLSTNPHNLLMTALEKNDVYNWKPQAPVRMTYTAGDHDVPPQNALLAYKTMKALGASVDIVKVSDTLAHVDALGPSFEQEINWFETLRVP